MSGIFAILGIAAGSTHAVTIGGSDPYGFLDGSFGSITPATFVDHGGNTQTIKGILYNTGSGVLAFRLNGAAVANTDTTFVAIVINGTRYTRASASYSANTPAGQSQWAWTPGVNDIGTSGTAILQVQ